MESKSPLNNVKEERAVLTNANFTRPTDHVASDQQEQPKFVSGREDVTVSVFADLPSSNKMPRENVRRLMAPKDCVTSPLELAFKYLLHPFISSFSQLVSLRFF